VYSAPPRLKRVPVLGTLWNLAVGVPGLFFAGSPDVRQLPLRLLVGLFSMLLIVSQLIHEAEDREDDRSGGIATVATLAGVQGALAAASMFLFCLPGAAWWLAAGMRARSLLTGGVALFAAGWALALLGRISRGDAGGLRRVRLRYRYTALALGAVVFAASLKF
jgi:4-hydroxybenzoate polyprenyltransferase